MEPRDLPVTPAWRYEERDFLSLASSYFGAMSILLERVFRYPWDRSSSAEMLFDPIMFLYRHAIECSLKHFLYSPFVNKKDGGHELHKLYEELEKHIDTLPADVLEPLKYITDWYKHYDTKDGSAYRYPFNKGETLFSDEIRKINRIDIRSVYEDMKATQRSFMYIANHFGGEDAAGDFYFHDEFDEFEAFDRAEKEYGVEKRYT